MDKEKKKSHGSSKKDKKKEKSKEEKKKHHEKEKEDMDVDVDVDEQQQAQAVKHKKTNDAVAQVVPSNQQADVQPPPPPPQQPQQQKQQVPAENRGYVIPPQQNTQKVPPKPQKSPFHWTKMLSDEMLNKLVLTQAVSGQDSEHMEGGWKLQYKGEDGILKNWTCHSCILRVVDAAIHGVGVTKDNKHKADQDRVYKIKLQADIDEELSKEDPDIAVQQDLFVKRMDAFSERIAQLLYQVSKQNLTESLFSDAARSYLINNEKDWNKMKTQEQNAKINEKTQELRKDPDAIKQVFGIFFNRMTTFHFKGDDQNPADRVPTFRMSSKVFIKPKKKFNEKDDKKGGKDSGNQARQVPNKFGGGEKGESNKKRNLKQLKDEDDDETPRGGEEDGGDDIEDYDEGKRWNETPDTKVAAIRENMRHQGYRRRPFYYYNHDGTKKDLGQFANDINYKVIDSGDYVQVDFGAWIYSLKTSEGRFGYRLQVGSRVWYIRQGKKLDEVAISEESKIGQIAPLRPKIVIPSAPQQSDADQGGKDPKKLVSDQSSAKGANPIPSGKKDKQHQREHTESEEEYSHSESD